MNCIKIGLPSVRENVFGKSYSLENSLQESIFREDLFLCNSSLLHRLGAARKVVEVHRDGAEEVVLGEVIRVPNLCRKGEKMNIYVDIF